MGKFKNKLLNINKKHVKILFKNATDTIEYSGFCDYIDFINGKWYVHLKEINGDTRHLSSTSCPDRDAYFYINENGCLNFIVSEQKVKQNGGE